MTGLLVLMLVLPAVLLRAQPQVTPLGPDGGDVRSLVVHPDRPDTVFLGTADGQLYVSVDFGERWQKLTPGLNRRNLVVDNLVFDPTDASTLYAGTWELKSDRGWLFRTRDGGRSWEEIPLGRYQSSVRAIAVAPSQPEILALGITEGVILSRDAGRTWDRITRGYRSLYNVESLAFDPQDAHTLYVGTWRLGWKTTDLGKKWQAIHRGMLFDSDLFSLLVDPLDPDILFASACTGVYKSVNRGESWQKLRAGLPKAARRTRTLHLDPLNPQTVYAGTTEGLFVSRNGGQSFQQLLQEVVVNAVVVRPGRDEVILAGTDDAGILKSGDAGRNFQAANAGFTHRQVAALAVASGPEPVYYAGVSADGRHGGFFFTRNPGADWESYNHGLGAAAADIKSILVARRHPRVYVATGAGLFAGEPGEAPWERVEGTETMSVLGIAFQDPTQEGLLLATSTGLFRLELRDRKLTSLDTLEAAGRVNAVFSDPASGHLFAATDQGLYRSPDGGHSWTLQKGGLPATAVNAVARLGNRLFCATRSGLYFSNSDGEHWSQIPGVYPIDITTLEVAESSGKVVAAADSVAGHLFYSRDGGQHWDILDLGTERSTIASLAFRSPDELLAGTLSEGVYRIAFSQPLFNQAQD